MNFSIRDDDINAYTDSIELLKHYAPVIEYCKPTFCVTPYAGAIYKLVRDHENVYTNRESRARYVKSLIQNHNNIEAEKLPIENNIALVNELKYLLKNDLIEIALHGITHNQTPKGYEFESDDLDTKSLIGAKKYVEDLFQIKVKTFSPPNNTISKKWRREVSRLGMNIVMSYGTKPWNTELNFHSILSQAKLISHRIANGRNINYPYRLNYSTHYELASYTNSPAKDLMYLKEGIDYVAEKRGTFILATHSYGFGIYDQLYKDFIDAIEYGKKRNFTFKFIKDCF